LPRDNLNIKTSGWITGYWQHQFWISRGQATQTSYSQQSLLSSLQIPPCLHRTLSTNIYQSKLCPSTASGGKACIQSYNSGLPTTTLDLLTTSNFNVHQQIGQSQVELVQELTFETNKHHENSLIITGKNKIEQLN